VHRCASAQTFLTASYTQTLPRAPAIARPLALIRMSRDPKSNQLLAALPPAEWQRWIAQLEHVDMPLGSVLYESGTTLSHV